MKVQLCWKTEKTPEGKIHVSKEMTVKEATDWFKKNESKIVSAYLRKFDGRHHIFHKKLKGTVFIKP